MAAAAASGPAFAQTPADNGDRNGDGVISREEFRNLVAQKVFAADKNGDGLLSADEWRFGPDEYNAFGLDAGQPVPADLVVKLLDKGFVKLDQNNDGQLASDEMRS